ncbi:MAG: Ig-like domain repeat protein [Candidatus Diapherotrites archaeon]
MKLLTLAPIAFLLILFSTSALAAVFMVVNSPTTPQYVKGTFTLDFNWWDTNTTVNDINLVIKLRHVSIEDFNKILAFDNNALDLNQSGAGAWAVFLNNQFGAKSLDLNFGAPADINGRGDLNHRTRLQLDTRNIPDGNYQIDINVINIGLGDANVTYTSDVNSLTFPLNIDNNGPSLIVTDVNAGVWQNRIGTVLTFTCIDRNSGCATLVYKVDSNRRSPVADMNVIDWNTATFTPNQDANVTATITLPRHDGNYAVDFYAIDRAGNDSNTIPGSQDRNTFTDGNVHRVYVLQDRNALITVNSPTTGTYTRGRTMLIDFNWTDPNDTTPDVNVIIQLRGLTGNYKDTNRYLAYDLNGLDGNAFGVINVADNGVSSMAVDANGSATDGNAAPNAQHRVRLDVNTENIPDGNYQIDINVNKYSDTNVLIRTNSTSLNLPINIDNNGAVTVYNDANINVKQQRISTVLTFTCHDKNSGCASVKYRVDTNRKYGATISGDWNTASFATITSDGNATTTITLPPHDGNYAVDFFAVDRAGNDSNSGATVSDANVATGTNVHRVYILQDRNASITINSPTTPTYSKGIATILDFNWTDPSGDYINDVNLIVKLRGVNGNNKDVNVWLAYDNNALDGNSAGTVSFDGNGMLSLIEDGNGSGTSGNELPQAQHRVRLLVNTANLHDGNYQADINLLQLDDQSLLMGAEMAGLSIPFNVDNNRPKNLISDANVNSWQKRWFTLLTFTCADANSGCATLKYRVDTDNTSTATIAGDWNSAAFTTMGADANVTTTITIPGSDGNWTIDYYAIDRAGNDSNSVTTVSDRNGSASQNDSNVHRVYILQDANAPGKITTDVNVNALQNASGIRLTFTCVDDNSGCTSAHYRVDTNRKSGVDINGDHDWNILLFDSPAPGLDTNYITLPNTDGNWTVDYYATDVAGNDSNVGATVSDANWANLSSRNVHRIHVLQDRNATITFNTRTSGGYLSGVTTLIDFNWTDPTDYTADINVVVALRGLGVVDYNIISIDNNALDGNGTGVTNRNGALSMIEDGNTTAAAGGNQLPNAQHRVRVLLNTANIGDSNYYIDVNVSQYDDQDISNFIRSDMATVPVSIRIDNNAPAITYTGSTSVTSRNFNLALTTNEPATCRYSNNLDVSTDQAYADMNGSTTTTLGTSHSWAVGKNNGTHSFYIRCMDVAQNANSSATLATITVAISSSTITSNTSTTSTTPSTSTSNSVQSVIDLITQGGKPTSEDITALLTAAGASENAIATASAAVGKVEVSRTITVIKTEESGETNKYKTVVTLHVANKQAGAKDVNIVEEIPKRVAASAGLISVPSDVTMKILKSDPIVQFSVSNVPANGSKDFNYSVANRTTTADANFYKPAVVLNLSDYVAPSGADQGTGSGDQNGTGDTGGTSGTDQNGTGGAPSTPPIDRSIIMGAALLIIIIVLAAAYFIAERKKPGKWGKK